MDNFEPAQQVKEPEPVAGPSCATANIVEAFPLQLTPDGNIRVCSNVATKYELTRSGGVNVFGKCDKYIVLTHNHSGFYTTTDVWQSDEDTGVSSSEEAPPKNVMKRGRMGKQKQLKFSPKPSSSRLMDRDIDNMPDSASEEELENDIDELEDEEERETASVEHWPEEGPFEPRYLMLKRHKSLEKKWQEEALEMKLEVQVDQVVREMVGVNEGMIGDDIEAVFDERPAGVSENENAKGIEGEYVFDWKESFESFIGQKETYARKPGPTISSTCPYDLFTAVWDEEIMNLIVNETNRYARHTIASLSESETGLPVNSRLLKWKETNVNELYIYFSILMYMTLCYRSRLDEYWSTGILEMVAFKSLMSRDRFMILSKFVHFVNNEVSTHTLTSYDRKIHKIRPILNHCNRKFQELYIPKQYLSLDESLLLWKGRLSWVQCIRTKAARFGIKSFELCESDTGYLLKTLLYAGKNTSGLEPSIGGFKNNTAKIVLKLSEGYLDVGHVLVMDNWYNQLSLTRYLKNRQTDVIGTQNRRQKEIPESIRSLTKLSMPRGQIVARHSGDISLVAWNDVNIVTMVSTHHTDEVYRSQRFGQPIDKPVAVRDYTKYMGGVDLKDQRLSMYPMERKRGTKWYMKVFRRLLNTTLANTYIMYLANCSAQGLKKKMTHRQYRNAVAYLLVRRHINVLARPKSVARQQVNDLPNHLDSGPHTLISTERSRRSSNDGSFRLQRRRCMRCSAAGRQRFVTTQCSRCNVGLCMGRCFEEYHTQQNFRAPSKT